MKRGIYRYHVMEDVGHKARVHPASVGNQVLAPFVHIHGAHWNDLLYVIALRKRLDD